MLVVWGVASVPVLAAPAATAVGSAADAGSAKPVEPTHDTIVSKFDNGSVSRVYYVLHGTEVRDGVSVTYHPNGNVAIEAPYVAGKLDGVFRSYYENGKVWKTIGYRNGIEEGFSISFHENGVRALRESYKAGILDGTSEEWNEKGVLVRRIPYEKGQIHGRAQVFDRTGCLERRDDF
jgi:Uncharacterized protein conserved in bacteria